MRKFARFAARSAGRRWRVSAVVGVAALILVVQGAFALTGTSALNVVFTHGGTVPRAVEPISQTNKTTGNITVGHSYKNDVSGPLMHLRRVALDTPRPEHEVPNMHPVSIHQNKPDGVLQKAQHPNSMPSPGLNFDGIAFPGVTCNCAPPDTNGEVGDTQYVQIVNQGFQVFDKTSGSAVTPALGIGTLWAGFGGACELHGFGDPVVLYDQIAGRWVITQFASATGGTPITDECIAVSQTSNAAGSYFRYGYHLGSDFFDYPHFGVWPDAYYMSMNVFNSSGTAFLGPQPFAFNRSAMLSGSPGTFITSRDPAFFTSSSDAFLPADLDGSIMPPSGAPDPFMMGGENTTAWKVWRFHVDFGTPANSTFTLAGNLAPAAYTEICWSGCIPQSGTSSTLAGLGDRAMYRAAYRRFADGHEALVGNQSVCVGGSGLNCTGGRAGIRWWEISGVTSGSPAWVQQSTYAPNDGVWRWMGSAAMDQSGDLAIGFSASNASIVPGVRYAGRLAGDPANDLTQGEALLFGGQGSQ
ncbi:MAG TPA: hypothetical protein VHK64_00380, partial [Nocardioidaceae bacterium]|nr:hypothetical protein [Nocardioidaceae bacterium]